MDSIAALATFFGWCTVINIGILIIVLVLAGAAHEGIGKMHAKIFGISQAQAKAYFFSVYLQYRLAIGVLNLVPYVALKIMS